MSVAFKFKLPIWKNNGVEPSDEWKNNGYSAGDAPAADTFNWFLHNFIGAIAEIQHMLETPVEITANANLNDYTEFGCYICGINARVATLTNCPTKSAFFMMVGRHAGVYQRLVEYHAAEPKIFFRNKDDLGTWGDWHREYTTANKPTITEIGAAASSHNHSASTIAAGELGGRVMANATASENLGNSQVRNINAGTSDLTAKSSSLGTGALYFVYE